jgi:DnaJ-class molecular chaperone
MADEQDDDEVAVATAHGPRECMPCRGAGKLISSLGGEPSTVVCPWCAGGGVRLTGVDVQVDAQAKWLDGAAGGPGGG